jgi:hypothetical protein
MNSSHQGLSFGPTCTFQLRTLFHATLKPQMIAVLSPSHVLQFTSAARLVLAKAEWCADWPWFMHLKVNDPLGSFEISKGIPPGPGRQILADDRFTGPQWRVAQH